MFLKLLYLLMFSATLINSFQFYSYDFDYNSVEDLKSLINNNDTEDGNVNPKNATTNSTKITSENQIIYELIQQRNYSLVLQKLQENDPKLNNYKRMKRIFRNAYKKNRNNFLGMITSLNSSTIRLNILTTYWEMRQNETKTLLPSICIEILEDIIRYGNKTNQTDIEQQGFIENILQNLRRYGKISRTKTIWNVMDKFEMNYLNSIENILKFLKRLLPNRGAIMAQAYFLAKLYKSTELFQLSQTMRGKIINEFKNLPKSIATIYYNYGIYLQHQQHYIRFIGMNHNADLCVVLGSLYVASSPWIVHHIRHDIFEFSIMTKLTKFSQKRRYYLAISNKNDCSTNEFSLIIQDEEIRSSTSKWQIIPSKNITSGGIRLYNMKFRVSICRSSINPDKLIFLKSDNKKFDSNNCEWMIQETD